MLPKMFSSRIRWMLCLALMAVGMAGTLVAYTQLRNHSSNSGRAENEVDVVTPPDREQRIESIRIWSEIMMFHLEFDAGQRAALRQSLKTIDPDEFRNHFAWTLIESFATGEQIERARTIRNFRVRRSEVIRANRTGTGNYFNIDRD